MPGGGTDTAAVARSTPPQARRRSRGNGSCALAPQDRDGVLAGVEGVLHVVEAAAVGEAGERVGMGAAPSPSQWRIIARRSCGLFARMRVVYHALKGFWGEWRMDARKRLTAGSCGCATQRRPWRMLALLGCHHAGDMPRETAVSALHLLAQQCAMSLMAWSVCFRKTVSCRSLWRDRITGASLWRSF